MINYQIDTEKKVYTSYFEYFLDKLPLINKIKKGKTIFVRVLRITKKIVIVDGNLKREAYIKSNEFSDKLGNIEIREGDFIEVVIKSLENSNGNIILSRNKFKSINWWYHLKNVFLSKTNIKGYIYEKIKGGFNVMLRNKRCFLPFSLVDKRILCNLPFYINKYILFRIKKVDFKKKNIILSRKPILRKFMNFRLKEFLKKIKVGIIIKGIVKNIINKGVFVHIGYVNTFVSYKNISWGPYKYSSEVLSINQAVKAKILYINRKKNLFFLGIKQTINNPWINIEKRYKVGYTKFVKIFRLTRNFIHVILEKNIFSLIKKSFTIKKNKNSFFVRKLKVNSFVEIIINKINLKKKKITLDLINRS